MNFKSFSCALLFCVSLTRAHGGHSYQPDSGDAAQYAQRHVRVRVFMHLFRFNQYHTRWRRSIICTQTRIIALL